MKGAGHIKHQVVAGGNIPLLSNVTRKSGGGDIFVALIKIQRKYEL
jgi:hypothetical protein